MGGMGHSLSYMGSNSFPLLQAHQENILKSYELSQCSFGGKMAK